MTENASRLLELALKAGATDAEVYQSSSLSHPVFFEGNRLKQLESCQSEGTALRLWREGCPGLAVAYGPSEPEILVEKALALSHLHPPETPELTGPRQEIHPPSGESVSLKTAIALGSKAIARIREAHPEVICTAELDCEQETTLLLNTRGLHCQQAETGNSFSLGVEWVRGEDFLGVYDGEYGRGPLEIEEAIERILQRLQWSEANATPPSGRLPILFTASAATLLWGTVAAALNGRQVLEKASPWSDRQGELVISPQLTLSQDPQRQPYACPFDDEGIPTQFFSPIAQGHLQQFYSDRATARALGSESTGNGFRPSLGRYPTPDLVNLIVEPGQGSLRELISQLDGGLIVDQVLGGGADLSGDFSLNVDLGYWVEGGEVKGRVKDTMVAGNVYTALKQVVALGGDSRWSGSCHTPALIVEGLSVVG